MIAYPIWFLIAADELDLELPFAILPVGLAGWAFRIRIALAVTAFELAAVTAIVNLTDKAGPTLLFDTREVPQILLIIGVAVAIGYLGNVRETLALQAREMEAIARATVALADGTEGRATLQGILGAAVDVVPSIVAAFVLSDASGDYLHVAATLGGPTSYIDHPYPVTTGITGRAWRSGETQRVADVLLDKDYISEATAPMCALAVPIRRDGRTRGVLYLERAANDPYTPRDERIMQSLANHAAIAVFSEERRHELAAATERFAAAFEAAPSGLIISTLPDQKIVDANGAFLTLIDRTRVEVIGRTTSELGLVDEDTNRRAGEIFGREGRLRAMDVQTDQLGVGTRHFVVSSERATIGGADHIITSATDVTAAKQAALDNERLALYDVLTGLPNRNLFSRRVADALRAATRTGHTVAVLLMDLDHFKDVNDTFGHRSGDLLLRAVGARLKAALPDHETAARLGGDEFAILLEGMAPDALRVSERIRRALEAPFELAGHGIDVSASIGISFFPEHGDTDTALLQHADIALYAAKEMGGGTVVYAAALDAHTPGRLALAAELKGAIAAKDLVLHYQPIVALRADRCAGVEALVRWPHATRGLIPPNEFIPTAEKSGLIKPMTDWVIGEALMQTRDWASGAEPLEISINISMRNLRDPTLPESVARHIAASQVQPSRVCLEITESVAMADPDRTATVLKRLRDIGVRLAIDDFGTGQSSLAYLRRLPVQTLKIDRSFISGLAKDDASRSIVKATIEMGHALGLEVTGEGVEDADQLETLRALGCDHAQGYLMARPMSGADIPFWLARHASDEYALA